jgi:glucan 1,3-beta-glucosidase
LRRVSLAVATVSGFGLVFDPRYRDFPVSLMAVAAVGFILVRLSTEGKPMDSAIEDDWLAGALALCASFVVINEGIHNLDALAWAAGALVLAGTVLVRRRLLV